MLDEFVARVQSVKSLVRALDEAQGSVADYPEYEALREGVVDRMREAEDVLGDLIAEFRRAADVLRIR